jgi:hypothetical protein
MSLKTSMSSSLLPMVPHNVNQLQYAQDLQDTRDVHYIGLIPTFEHFYFHSEPENIMKYKTNNLIVSAVESLNQHYTTMISSKRSELSSASKITNLCRDVFLGSNVQKLIQTPKEEATSIFYTTAVDTSKKIHNYVDVDYDTLCEMSFPIPRLFIDDLDKVLKIEITKSISYSKIADMLEILYTGDRNDILDKETTLKISKLKYLIKKIRFIEESSRENTDLHSKIHNVHERITDYFSTFKELEYMFGDPELHYESIRKGLQNAFDTKLINQETEQNEIKARAVINSYILPIFSSAAAVSDTSIEYFTNTANRVITGFNLDKHFYNLVFIAMGTLVSCVAVGSCVYKKRNGTCATNDSKELEMLKKEIKLLKLEKQLENDFVEPRHLKQNDFIEEPRHLIEDDRYLPYPEVENKLLLKRCPNGQRRNKISSKCLKKSTNNSKEPDQVNIENEHVINKPLLKRCPNGQRRDKVSGNCLKK